MVQRAERPLYFPEPSDPWSLGQQRLLETAPLTQRRYRDVWAHYRDFLHGTEISEASANTFLSRRLFEVAAKTLRVERAALVFLLNRVMRLKADLLRVKVEERLPRHVPPEEHQRRMLTACENWSELALFSLFLGSGLRVNEVIGLQTKDVAQDASFIRIVRKGGKERYIPLKPMVQRPMWAIRNRPGKIFRGGYNTVRRKLFDPVIARAGLRGYGYTPHSLRHAFGTAVYRETKDLHLTKEALGHVNLNTTEIYIHMNPEEIWDRVPDHLEALSHG